MPLELVVPFKTRLLAYFALREMDGISLNESIRIRMIETVEQRERIEK